MEHLKTKDFKRPHADVILRPENLDNFTSRLHINHFNNIQFTTGIRIPVEARVYKTKASRTRTNQDP
jgi:hypothetical protein